MLQRGGRLGDGTPWHQGGREVHGRRKVTGDSPLETQDLGSRGAGTPRNPGRALERVQARGEVRAEALLGRGAAIRGGRRLQDRARRRSAQGEEERVQGRRCRLESRGSRRAGGGHGLAPGFLLPPEQEGLGARPPRHRGTAQGARADTARRTCRPVGRQPFFFTYERKSPGRK